MSEVIDKFVETALIDSERSNSKRALITYLETVLFNPDRLSIIDENPDLSDKIIQIYYNLAPTKLASVILESLLCQYNQNLALSLLEQSSKVATSSNSSEDNKRKSSNPNINQSFIPLSPSLSASNSYLYTSSPGFPALHSAHSSLSIDRKTVFVRALLYLDLGIFISISSFSFLPTYFIPFPSSLFPSFSTLSFSSLLP